MSTTQARQPQFPGEFLFGAATAAYQIEGAASEDGRKASIWDTFSKTPGKVRNAHTGDIACDHYHRMPADLDLLASLNLDAYRFSIAWPRLVPDGTGSTNPRGLDFYDRLVDGCLQRGLKPFATLYHWDLPEALQQKGGWTVRDTAHAFANYAELVATHFADRLECITTFNEPWCSALLGNLYGVHAPGNRHMDTALSVVHHQHLAHGLAVQAIKSEAATLDTGIVLNLQSVYPFQQEQQHIDAVSRYKAFHNDMFIHPLFEGHYPDKVVEALGNRLPGNWQKDLDTIHQPLDFWGLNYYTPSYVTADADPQAEFPSAAGMNKKAGVPTTDMGWEVDADTLTDLLVELYRNYTLPPCYITENGAAYNDEPVNGIIDDQRRIDYYDSHLHAVAAAMNKGVAVKGYFAWSLMDNFEWAEGYSMRFGLVHVDYATQVRTIKNSGLWYAELALQHRQRRMLAESTSG